MYIYTYVYAYMYIYIYMLDIYKKIIRYICINIIMLPNWFYLRISDMLEASF